MILNLNTKFDSSLLLYTQDDVETVLAKISRTALHLLTDEIQKTALSASGTALGEFYIFTHGIRIAEEKFNTTVSAWGFEKFQSSFTWLGGGDIDLNITFKSDATHPFQVSAFKH